MRIRKFYLASAIVCLPFFLVTLYILLFHTDLLFGQKFFIFVFCSMGMVRMFELAFRVPEKPILRIDNCTFVINRDGVSDAVSGKTFTEVIDKGTNNVKIGKTYEH